MKINWQHLAAQKRIEIFQKPKKKQDLDTEG